ncbi:ER protein BIG1 [Colletotrichum orchidophilum]|uniref:Protein BIG1 n=1 Tax=Colletotrichum orchidophilum TaxID=1209926 RepID=A0A1G4B3L6_9PEZI|nr:ER protein BIG1 [Colletotrichum orchidophilum]OHE95905.1 ER protein BIG1 [Colletotrichum orchidophilum]
MRLSRTAGLMALCSSVRAFTDSSPFIMLSTAEFAKSNPAQLQTQSQVFKTVQDLLSSCPTDRYLLVSQPNVNAADIRNPDNGDCQSPNLCRAISDKDARGVYSVAEVVGEVPIGKLAGYIKASCAGKIVEIEEVRLTALGRDVNVRAATLADNDHVLGQRLEKLHKASESYTVIYLASPSEPTYEAEFMEPLHAELKRHEASLRHVRRAKNETEWSKLPLFEKYVFFSPGVFHALIATIVLFSILGVGIRALASLEIPYGAFEKENGPAAHKKAQ